MAQRSPVPGFQRLRGELNGVLPRLEEKVERVIDRRNGREETEREYFEKVRVHETEIGTLFEQVRKNADADANREQHGRQPAQQRGLERPRGHDHGPATDRRLLLMGPT